VGGRLRPTIRFNGLFAVANRCSSYRRIHSFWAHHPQPGVGYSLDCDPREDGIDDR
jgi:hypothetical protein